MPTPPAGWRGYLPEMSAGLILALLIIFYPPEAYAQTNTMRDVICAIMAVIYGNFGRAIATLGIMGLGIGATMGKISWGVALTVAVGIGITFSSILLFKFLVRYGNNVCWAGY